MRQDILLWVIIFLCVPHFTARTVVIIIHGSFATTTSWPQPDGDFFKELENQAHQLGQKVISFCWSGIPTDQEIIKGGKMLAQLIMSYPPSEEIFLVGHSHGGNVINIASQLLYKLAQEEKPEFKQEVNPIIIEIPILITTPSFELLATTKTGSQTKDHVPYHEHATYEKDVIPASEPGSNQFTGCRIKVRHDTGNLNDLSQSITFQSLLAQATSELKLWGSKFLTRSNAIPSIQFSYLLGTPVNMAKFWPHMEIIKNMILFYSDGDLVQPVLGIFEKTYPDHKNRVNIKVRLYNSDSKGKTPSHSDLHHPTIGRWLLCIPKVLSQLRIGNFENFNFLIDGTMHFYETKEPYYFSSREFLR
ncbi:hypothetical protein JST56_04190 [Candidatus Dependentiae bacterium]|nr:hypothetical protein [Candidatus Dependentiae bacterium]